MPHFSYLIIGGGMTADAAVQGIREIDPDTPVGLIGEEPPRLGGVAIMTDTDDTKDEATAWYGDIFLESAPKERPAPADTSKDAVESHH